MDLSDASEKKSPLTRPGIDAGILHLVAQRYNHYATLICFYIIVIFVKYCS